MFYKHKNMKKKNTEEKENMKKHKVFFKLANFMSIMFLMNIHHVPWSFSKPKSKVL